MENINKETSASVSGNATAQAGVKNEPKKNGYRKNYQSIGKWLYSMEKAMGELYYRNI